MARAGSRSALTFLLVSMALGACATTESSTSAGRDSDQGEWLEPSPALADRIEQHAARVPWTHGFEERIDLIRWFAGVGEPAYPTLLELAADPRPDVASMALAALGATRDARLVLHLRALPSSDGGGTDLSLERARALLMLGDWEALPQLIEGLRDERLYTRALCARTLEETTGERFGFEASAEPEVREKSVERWDAWWAERNTDPLLASQ